MTPTPSQQRFEVSPDEDHERLDSFLVKHFSRFSRVKLQRAIADQQVLINGRAAKSSTRLKHGQIITVDEIKHQSEAPIPEKIELDILFEDEHLVAINKPPGMVVHPAKGHWSGTLTSALAYHFQKLSTRGGVNRPGIIHRLDRDTSGVILVAKTDHAHLTLSSQFENRTVEKEYFAIVTPAPDRDRDLIEKSIGEHPYQREKKAIREGHSSSRSASTFYEVKQRFPGFATLCIKPKTGRTHQIRVHMGSVGSPVLCDKLYSGRARITVADFDRKSDDSTILLDRQALHARRIKFSHPETGKPLEIEAELPADIARTIDVLRRL
jgi:23S rRNA pseudouridine1911/1915/1917 synthase